MHKLVATIGIVFLLLSLNSTLTYADTEGVVEVVNIYDLSREYYTVKEVYNILGVRVTLEMTTPRLFINGENHTFTYRVLVGDAPSDWILNVTKVTFSGECVSREHVQRPAKVLKGGESLTGQFTVKTEKNLYPGFWTNCYPKITISYFARFGTNREEDRNTVLARVPIRSKELPLEFKPNIIARVVEPISYRLGEIRLIGEIKIKNVQSWDIIIKEYRYSCSHESPEKVIGPVCGNRELSSVILRPGQEYVLKVDYSFYYKTLPMYMKYDVIYQYPGGQAANWIVLRITKSFSSAEPQVARQETKSPVAATAATKSPTTIATTAITTTAGPPSGPGGAPVWPVTPAYMNTLFGVLMLIVPIALVTIAGVAIAAHSARKSRTVQSRPEAKETAQGPSEPTDQSITQVSTQGTEPSLPTSQETTQSQTAVLGQAEQPKQPQPELRQPKLRTPVRLRERSTAIISKLASARTRIELGDLNDAILEIHKAVNATISLILEAEGLSMKGPDGEELKMGEKFRLIAERGWVSWNNRRYFTRLQYLRNMIEHHPERIHTLQTTASEVQELFRFHENFVRTSLRTLEKLAKED
jgi:hypothetical protein